jgi:signal transduction histidine kinase/streptogramin lyase
MSVQHASGWKSGLAIVCLVCLWLAPLFAGEPEENWSKRVWQTDDGLPAANVTAILQTPDDYLWLATQSGLARFDGEQFDVVPIPVGRPRPIVRAMIRDHAGNFWLAESGGVVVRFGSGNAEMFSVTNGLPDELVLQMIETPDHSIWLSYANDSVYRITPDNQVVRLTSDSGLGDDGTCCFTLDAHGVLWFAKGFEFGFLRGGHFVKSGILTERNAQILCGRNGGLWFCTSTQVLKSMSNATPVVLASFSSDANHVKPSTLYEDSYGSLWIGTASDGLFHLNHTNLFEIETSHNKIHAIFQDREGSIWVGTDGGGLNRLFPTVIELLGRDEGLPFETVRSIGEDRTGDVWVVTQDGALSRLPGNDWAGGGPIESWPGGLAHCVAEDHQGGVWIGTYSRCLFRWKDGQFSQFNMHNGLAGTDIRSLLVDKRNDLWIGLDKERLVQRFHDGNFQSFTQPTNSRAVRAMAEDTSGRIWFGTIDGHLLRLDGNTLSEVAFPVSEGMHPIRCLTTSSDGSLWIGNSVIGVCRLKDGKFARIGTEDGLFDGNICAMMPDTRGRMWFASDRGIFFVNLEQLDQFADGKINQIQSNVYGRAAGLPGLQAYYGFWPGAVVTRSGEILFPTHSGIAVVFPDRVRANIMPPNVLIQRVSADGKEIKREPNEMVKLPPDVRKIEITYTAPSFIEPEQIRFRYRLVGWSDDWSEVERNRSAIFPRLPPGHYTFQIQASNDNGIWDEKGASFGFMVMPFFWQSWLFRIPTALFILIIVVAVVRYFLLRRFRLLLQKVEQEAALQKERTRIAQDMHDELGARFTQISLLGELSRNALDEPGRAHDFLGQISRVAQIGVKSLDEIVWAVNPRNDTLHDLLDYTGQYARDFLAAAGIECRLNFPDALPNANVSGEVRHSIFLIVKETLNNVVKHAQASQVKISFDTSAGTMRWTIEDNGKGFEKAPDNTLADGLRNINARSTALGGRVEIVSRADEGTQITLKVPLQK